MLILLSVAIAPSLALFSYFYLRTEFMKEPSRLLFHCFIYGAILTFPILFVQYVFAEEQVFQHAYVQDVLFTGTVEEFFKWLILLLVIYRHVEFDVPNDGILYGTSIALGFATVENVLYLLEFGIDAAFFRAFLPVSSHALFGVVMGFYFGKAKWPGKLNIKIWLAIGLFGPLSLHILYNSILFLENSRLELIIPFMLFLWWFALRKVKQAHQLTIDHYHDRPPLIP
ncbi:glutamic-type intramembrane protease PrsW [Planococcus lenghuensis]|uniref:Protease PrsW n=1 Tax=Planococcus lenghuensis TaxID=2213202 RepID=A0A1Q2KZL4_9BACL|nr:glutamic-type intramembrane protease PrsW [Planococcus lenghuensis]AQQ53640.1 protease PrsW [Planococcus lenghuensis]